MIPFRSAVTAITVALVWIARAATGWELPQPPEPDRLWFAILAQSPVRDMTEFEHTTKVFIPKTLVDQSVRPMELVFRKKGDQTGVAHFSYNYFAQRSSYPAGQSKSPERIWPVPDELKNLPDGDYIVAVTLDGARCSNVAEFTIDKHCDFSKLAPAALVPMEAPSYLKAPLVGLRINGVGEPIPALTYSDAAYAPLIVDGVKRAPSMLVWAGPNPSLTPSARWQFILDTSWNYAPAVGPKNEHSISLDLEGFKAGPLTVTMDMPLGNAWDVASKK